MIRTREKIIESLLLLSAAISILTTAGILWVLISESSSFFSEVSIGEFLFDPQWTPLFDDKHFGIMPLIAGTMLTSVIAVGFAMPIGISIAVYLNEYAPKGFRKVIKPILEVLAAYLLFVYGFLHLSSWPFFTTDLSADGRIQCFPCLPAIVMGIMIIPMIYPWVEDDCICRAEIFTWSPNGIGAKRFQTALKF